MSVRGPAAPPQRLDDLRVRNCYLWRAMRKLQIDHEFPSRTWWQSGGQALWDAISDGAGGVVVEDDLAASWLDQASRLPGWSEGHEYAPHPIASSPIAEDDGDLL